MAFRTYLRLFLVSVFVMLTGCYYSISVGSDGSTPPDANAPDAAPTDVLAMMDGSRPSCTEAQVGRTTPCVPTCGSNGISVCLRDPNDGMYRQTNCLPVGPQMNTCMGMPDIPPGTPCVPLVDGYRVCSSSTPSCIQAQVCDPNTRTWAPCVGITNGCSDGGAMGDAGAADGSDGSVSDAPSSDAQDAAVDVAADTADTMAADVPTDAPADASSEIATIADASDSAMTADVADVMTADVPVMDSGMAADAAPDVQPDIQPDIPSDIGSDISPDIPDVIADTGLADSRSDAAAEAGLPGCPCANPLSLQACMTRCGNISLQTCADYCAMSACIPFFPESCGTDAGADAASDVPAEASPDAVAADATDAAPDIASDATDVSADVAAADVAADVPPDASSDVTPETAVDAVADAAADVPAEASPDVVAADATDAAPDIASDATDVSADVAAADVAADVPPDASSDVTPETAVDAVADAAASDASDASDAADGVPMTIALNPAVFTPASCPSGWITVVYDNAGRELRSSPGASSFTVTVTSAWRGWSMMTAICGPGPVYTYYTGWILGRTARSQGVSSINLNGTELADLTLTCIDVFSSGVKPAIPMHESLRGSCPR